MVVFMFSHMRGPSKFSSLERNWRSWQTWPAGKRDRLDFVECFCIHTSNWIISPNRQGVKQLFERTTYWFWKTLLKLFAKWPFVCFCSPLPNAAVWDLSKESIHCLCKKGRDDDKVMFPNIQKWGPIAHWEKAPCHASRVWQWTKYIDIVFANEAHCNL